MRRDDAGRAVGEVEGHPGPVDEELLARAVLLAHDDVELAPPRAVQVAEAGVAVAVVGVCLAVLLPQERQRDATPLELAVDDSEVREPAVPRHRQRRGEAPPPGRRVPPPRPGPRGAPGRAPAPPPPAPPPP